MGYTRGYRDAAVEHAGGPVNVRSPDLRHQLAARLDQQQQSASHRARRRQRHPRCRLARRRLQRRPRRRLARRRRAELPAARRRPWPPEQHQRAATAPGRWRAADAA
eukprot:1934316-Pyramimonas_sp.AAC.1